MAENCKTVIAIFFTCFCNLQALGSEAIAIKVGSHCNFSLMWGNKNFIYSCVASSASVLFSFSVTWVAKRTKHETKNGDQSSQ